MRAVSIYDAQPNILLEGFLEHLTPGVEPVDGVRTSKLAVAAMAEAPMYATTTRPRGSIISVRTSKPK